MVYGNPGSNHIVYLGFTQVPDRLYILAQSDNKSALNIANTQHLYVERTANHIGVWLNGYLLTSGGVTLYTGNNTAKPPQHIFNTSAVKHCRTFNRALTGSEIARLMFQDSNKYTPYPEVASTVTPRTTTSGNAIFTNWNPLARGFKKAFIIKPSRVLTTGEYITVTETQVNFNVYSTLAVDATLSIGLGNVSTQAAILTLEPIVSYTNNTIELNSENAALWYDGHTVSASSTYAGYSSAVLVSKYSKWSIDTATTTTTLLSSPNIVSSNVNPLKIKVNGNIEQLPAGLTYKPKILIPVLNNYTTYANGLNGGSFVDTYYIAGTYWGLYVGVTTTTLVKRVGTVINTYQLPLHDSAFRLGVMSNTEIYVNGSTRFYKFDGSLFLRVSPTLATPASNDPDILGEGTGKAFYRFDPDLSDFYGNYDLTKIGTAEQTTTKMRFGSGIRIAGASNYATNTLTWVGATNRVYSFWVIFPVVTGYYNWCFGGSSDTTGAYNRYSWFINATNKKLAVVSSGFDNCDIVANRLYHVVIQVNHTSGAYTVYMDQSLRTTGVNALFQHTFTNSTYPNNTYQFFGFMGDNGSLYQGASSYLHYFRIIDLPTAITQEQVDTLYYEGASTGFFTLTNPKSFGDKVIDSYGYIYKNTGSDLVYVSSLTPGSGTNFWVRKSVGMIKAVSNLYGKLYSGDTLLSTTTDTSLNSYEAFKNNTLYVANLKTDRTIETYSITSNTVSAITQKSGVINSTATALIGYIQNGNLTVGGAVETRDIAIIYNGTQTICYYHDGAGWVAFDTRTGLFPIGDTPVAIAGVEISADYGSMAPSGLEVTLSAIPSEHIIDVNEGVNAGFYLSNNNSTPSSDSVYTFPTPATDVFDFTTGITTKTYNSWVTPPNQAFLHTRITGAITNMQSLTVNTVKV